MAYHDRVTFPVRVARVVVGKHCFHLPLRYLALPHAITDVGRVGEPGSLCMSHLEQDSQGVQVVRWSSALKRSATRPR